jgi:hypothetical protein
LGNTGSVDQLTVVWPSGLKTTVTNLDVNRGYTFREPTERE